MTVTLEPVKSGSPVGRVLEVALPDGRAERARRRCHGGAWSAGRHTAMTRDAPRSIKAMSHRLGIIGLTPACVYVLPVAFNQEQIVRVPGAVYDADFPNEKPGPRRGDLSGIWEPARGPGDAIGAQGAKSYPDTDARNTSCRLQPQG